MRGAYEHSWQEAMAGATIEPSEALWENIASNLDNERGRNYWVTLLMIAATISIAFAIPLTMGTLDYNAQPNHNIQIGEATEPTEQISNLKSQISNNTENPIPKTQNPTNQNPTNQNTQTPSSNKQLAVDNKQLSESPNDKNQITNNRNTKTLRTNGHSTNSNELLTNSLVTISTQKVTDLQRLGNAELAPIESYYMVPYFLPIKKEDISKTSLLASLNMGTGSVSNNTGGGALMEAAFDQGPSPTDFGSANKNAGERMENSGTAYYIGAGVEFSLGNRWSLLTGLGYRAQYAEGMSNIIQEKDGSYQPLSAYAPVTSGSAFLSESYNYSATNNYLSVPIAFKYPFIRKKVRFRGGLGISTDLMLTHKINSEAYGSASYSPESQDYKRLLLGATATLDISYSLNSQYSIAFETGYRRGLTSIDENKEHFPSSFTVGVILFYKIK